MSEAKARGSFTDDANEDKFDCKPVTPKKLKEATSTTDILPPKRPMNAYNVFYREERIKLLGPDAGTSDEIINGYTIKKKRPHRKGKGEIPLADMAKHVGRKWKQLSKQDLDRYREMAKADMERYRRDMIIYNKLIKVRKEHNWSTGETLRDRITNCTEESSQTNMASCREERGSVTIFRKEGTTLSEFPGGVDVKSSNDDSPARNIPDDPHLKTEPGPCPPTPSVGMPSYRIITSNNHKRLRQESLCVIDLPHHEDWRSVSQEHFADLNHSNFQVGANENISSSSLPLEPTPLDVMKTYSLNQLEKSLRGDL